MTSCMCVPVCVCVCVYMNHDPLFQVCVSISWRSALIRAVFVLFFDKPFYFEIMMVFFTSKLSLNFVLVNVLIMLCITVHS